MKTIRRPLSRQRQAALAQGRALPRPIRSGEIEAEAQTLGILAVGIILLGPVTVVLLILLLVQPASMLLGAVLGVAAIAASFVLNRRRKRRKQDAAAAAREIQAISRLDPERDGVHRALQQSAFLSEFGESARRNYARRRVQSLEIRGARVHALVSRAEQEGRHEANESLQGLIIDVGHGGHVVVHGRLLSNRLHAAEPLFSGFRLEHFVKSGQLLEISSFGDPIRATRVLVEDAGRLSELPECGHFPSGSLPLEIRDWISAVDPGPYRG
jgi:hypothetical protein